MSLQDEPQFERVATWALPSDPQAFMKWLRVAVPDGSDQERVSTFLTYPAAEHMPVSLREALTSVSKEKKS